MSDTLSFCLLIIRLLERLLFTYTHSSPSLYESWQHLHSEFEKYACSITMNVAVHYPLVYPKSLCLSISLFTPFTPHDPFSLIWTCNLPNTLMYLWNREPCGRCLWRPDMFQAIYSYVQLINKAILIHSCTVTHESWITRTHTYTHTHSLTHVELAQTQYSVWWESDFSFVLQAHMTGLLALLSFSRCVHSRGM